MYLTTRFEPSLQLSPYIRVQKLITNFRQDADLRQDPDRADHHPGGGAQRHHRECQGQDPGEHLSTITWFLCLVKKPT